MQCVLAAILGAPSRSRPLRRTRKRRMTREHVSEDGSDDGADSDSDTKYTTSQHGELGPPEGSGGEKGGR